MSWVGCNLKIPAEAHKRLHYIAGQEGTTVADLLRRGTKLLLFAQSIKRQDSGTRLLIERGGRTQEIVLELI